MRALVHVVEWTQARFGSGDTPVTQGIVGGGEEAEPEPLQRRCGPVHAGGRSSRSRRTIHRVAERALAAEVSKLGCPARRNGSTRVAAAPTVRRGPARKTRRTSMPSRLQWHNGNIGTSTHTTVARIAPIRGACTRCSANVAEWCADAANSHSPSSYATEWAQQTASRGRAPPRPSRRILATAAPRIPAPRFRSAFVHSSGRSDVVGLRLAHRSGSSPEAAQTAEGSRGYHQTCKESKTRDANRCHAESGMADLSERRDAAARRRASHRPGRSREWGRDRRGAFVSFRVGAVTHRLRWIPPGRFWMGSPEDEEGRFEREGPRHEVELTRGYWMGETPVTQALWEAVTGKNPSSFEGAERPVEQVSWHDSVAFIEALNERVRGLDARLPTEAEWERACRGGTDGPTWLGANDEKNLDAIAWYDANSGGRDPRRTRQGRQPLRPLRHARKRLGVVQRRHAYVREHSRT